MLSSISPFPVEVNSIIVLCKLSDGTVRSINTDRKTEVEILSLIENYSDSGISISNNVIRGLDIGMPDGFKSLSDFTD